MLPASFIAWMIYAKEGAASPYYAGLNLVLLCLAFVLHWTFRESLFAAALVVVLYLSRLPAARPDSRQRASATSPTTSTSSC